MLNLFENYQEKEEDLHYALNQSGFTQPTVVLNDNGYLPQDILSPIRYFTEVDNDFKKRIRRPLFFNEISTPNFWEIKGDGQKAEIFDGYKKVGTILYSENKGDYRFVRAVEWFNDQGKKRSVDLYNQYGFLFGKETYSDGVLTLTTYFNSQKKEVLLFNHITQTIQVLFKDKNYIFENFVDFIIFYFEVSGIETEQIFYNSLALPFFVTESLKKKHPEKNYQHTLFWQEESGEIPGNMRHILESKHSSTKNIIIQDKKEYQHFVHQAQILGLSKDKMKYLGYMYDFIPRHTLYKSIFILTNSDQMEKLEELIKKLPRYHFNIAARTTMSDKLLAYDHFSNVTLYPTIENEEIEKLIAMSGLYFDINHGIEVDKIVRRAFEGNLLIYSFKDIIHDTRYIRSTNIFDGDQVEKMIQTILKDTSNYKRYKKELEHQRIEAGHTSISKYKEILI